MERQRRHEQRQQEREADPVKVQNLVDMGFEEERVKRILKNFKNNLNMSMDYLINTPAENDILLNQSSSQSTASVISYIVYIVQFAPNEDSLKMLMEMGYSRDDSIYALRVTSNSLEHACTYLMSNPNPSQNQQSSMRIGLSSFFRSVPAESQSIEPQVQES